jgi:hypothetical protein
MLKSKIPIFVVLRSAKIPFCVFPAIFCVSSQMKKRGAFCAPLWNLCQFNGHLTMRPGLALPQVIRMDFIGTNHLDLNQNPVTTMSSAIDRESNPRCGPINHPIAYDLPKKPKYRKRYQHFHYCL